MRIVNIITALGYGGAERLLAQVYARLQGHELHVIYLKDLTDMVPHFPPGVQFHYVPLGRSCAGKIRQLLLKIKPDVVHTHLGHADLLGLWASRGLPLRQVCTMHNIWFKFSKVDWAIFAAYRLLFATVARRAQVVCISQAVRRHVINRLGVSEKRAHLLYNGVPQGQAFFSRSQARQQLRIKDKDRMVLFVGRLEKQKNVGALLQAVAQIKEKVKRLKLHIIGDGSLRQELATQAQQLGLQGIIEMHGTVGNVEPWFAAADVFALPSIFEGMGIVIAEAFRAGVPVVATNIEGPAELIENGANGLLVPPNDVDALALALLAVLNDVELATELGLNGLNSFNHRFNMDAYARRIEEIYEGKG